MDAVIITLLAIALIVFVDAVLTHDAHSAFYGVVCVAAAGAMLWVRRKN